MTIPPDPLDCSPVTVLVALVVAGAQLSLDPSGRVRVRARQKLPANLLAAARFWAPALAQVAGGLEAPPPGWPLRERLELYFRASGHERAGHPSGLALAIAVIEIWPYVATHPDEQDCYRRVRARNHQRRADELSRDRQWFVDTELACA